MIPLPFLQSFPQQRIASGQSVGGTAPIIDEGNAFALLFKGVAFPEPVETVGASADSAVALAEIGIPDAVSVSADDAMRQPIGDEQPLAVAPPIDPQTPSVGETPFDPETTSGPETMAAATLMVATAMELPKHEKGESSHPRKHSPVRSEDASEPWIPAAAPIAFPVKAFDLTAKTMPVRPDSMPLPLPSLGTGDGEQSLSQPTFPPEDGTVDMAFPTTAVVRDTPLAQPAAAGQRTLAENKPKPDADRFLPDTSHRVQGVPATDTVPARRGHVAQSEGRVAQQIDAHTRIPPEPMVQQPQPPDSTEKISHHSVEAPSFAVASVPAITRNEMPLHLIHPRSELPHKQEIGQDVLMEPSVSGDDLRASLSGIQVASSQAAQTKGENAVFATRSAALILPATGDRPDLPSRSDTGGEAPQPLLPLTFLAVAPTADQALPSISTETFAAADPVLDDPLPILRQLVPQDAKITGTTQVLLFPKELGQVWIEIHEGPRGLHVTVTAERHDIRDLIQRHRAELAAEFKAAGLTNPVITVVPAEPSHQVHRAEGTVAPGESMARRDDVNAPNQGQTQGGQGQTAQGQSGYGNSGQNQTGSQPQNPWRRSPFTVDPTLPETEVSGNHASVQGAGALILRL